MNHPVISNRVAASILLLFAALPPASAQEVSITGDVTPSPATSPVWEVGEELIVGNIAEGSLTIGAAGSVSNTKAFLGVNSGILGSAEISGGTWTNTGSLTVGYNGQGILTINSGGSVSSAGGFLGYGSSSSENTALITGTGSSWINTDTLYVGNQGSGNTLTVSAGGLLSATAAAKDVVIGLEDGSDGNKITVTGAGSEFVNDATLYVGNKGDNNQLEILDGGLVTSKNVRIGGDALSSGNTATVDGASVWNISGTQLRIGSGGDNNTLSITGGGTVTVATGLTLLGRDATADGNTLLITGTDSTLNTVTLTIGRLGTNNTVTVADNGSLIVSSASITVAEQGGSSGTLEINSGGVVNVNSGVGVVTLGTALNSTGTLNIGAIDGTTTAGELQASEVTGGLGTAVVNFNQTDAITFAPTITGSIAVNQLGTGQTTLTGEHTYTGGTTVDGGTLVVNGSVGAVGNTSDLYVGKNNGGASLTVSEGGVLTNGKTVIGYDAASDGNTVLVTGEGTQWNSSVTFHLGYNGSGNEMTVSDGAQVSVSNLAATNVDALIGFNDGANDNVLTVTGEGSSFTNNATLYVGRSGTGNELDVLAGGLVTSKNVRIGGGSGSNGTTSDNVANVDGAGSTWNVSGTMRVGSSGDNSKLTISNGGAVNVTGNTFVGYDATADGSSVVVTDADSTWAVNALTIGRLGTNSTVTVTDEGSLTATAITVAEQGGSSGALEINSGGVVNVNSGVGVVTLGAALNSTGTLNIGAIDGTTTAGELQASEVTGGAGTAVVNFNQTDDVTFAPKITGGIAVKQLGAGQTTLAVANTYTGGTTIGGGTLVAANTAALGTGPVTLNSGGILAAQGSLSGISSLTWNGGNILLSPGADDAITTTGAFSNGGGGAFIIGATGLEKDVTYTLVNFASTNFLVGQFSATSSNLNTEYQSDFTLNGGNVQIVFTGATSSGDMLHNSENGVPVFTDFTATGNIVSGKTPSDDQETDTTIHSLTTTTGHSLDVPDANTLTITGTSDTVIVDGASLNLDGVLVADTLVLDPGSLMTGHGQLQGDLFNNGTLAPGNSPGTTNIAGNYTQLPGGTLQIELASLSVFDQLAVTGSATLAGTLEVLSFGGFTPAYGDQFAFLNAASISGAFDTITTWNPALFRAVFITSGGTGSIVIAPASYTLMALTPNQFNVAQALDSFIGATSGDENVVTDELDQLTTAEFPAALDAIGPGQYESLVSMAISHSNAQSQSVQQHLNYLRLMDASGVGEIQRNAWAQLSGIYGDGRDVANVPNYHTSAGGFLAGVDLKREGAVEYGGFIGYQRTDSKHNNSGRTKVDSSSVGAYASCNTGKGFYTNVILDAGINRYDVQRPIAFGGLNRRASSDTNGHQLSSTIDFGYDYKIGKFTLTPTVAAQYTYVNIDAINEGGADSLDLKIRSQNADSFRSSAGVRGAYTFNLSKTVALIPQASLLWQHEYLDTARTLHASLEGGTAGSFDYRTAASGDDAGYAGAGVALQVGNRWSVHVTYNNEFTGGDAGGYSITSGVNVSF